MSVLLGILLVGLTSALALRLRASWLQPVLLALLLIALAALGAQPWVLASLALLGFTGALLPRLNFDRPAPVSRSARPKRNKVEKSRPAPVIQGGMGLESTYEILDKVGIGGMATVYKARTRSDGRMVALKIPQEKYVGDTRFVRRFHREAEVLAHLSHPNIVKVFDHGNVGDTHFIAMEFLDGEGLDRLIENRRLSIRSTVQIIARVAEALQHIHAQGIIHRDIKPGNIMVLRGAIQANGDVDPRGVRLMDFGIAAGKVLTRLTITGARIGTPVYMSPEQAKGQRIDHKSDIYSLGVVFYEAVCHQPPFQGGYEAVIHQQIFQMPTPPKQVNPEVPQALSDIIQRMLEKDPAKRPGLDQVLEVLGGKWEQNPGLVAPFYLGLAVEAKRGTLRLMSSDGVLARMWSGVGSGRGMFPSPPLAVAVDGNGDFWISLYEFGGGAVRLVHCFSPEGELKLSIAPYGMKFGEVLYPVSVAASQEAVYVLDAETSSITKFDLAGTPLKRFGEAGRGKGTFDTPRMLIAGRHYLYVLDYGNRQVQRLSLEGEYLSRYAFRRSKETAELRLLGGLGTTTDEHLLIYDADGQKIRKVSLDGQIVASYPLPVLEGEDASSLVEMRMHEGIIYGVRRGANRIHRIQENGTPLAPLEVYAAVRGMDLWFNPEEPKD